MNYPKPIMSLSELATLGFSRPMLYQMAHSRYCDCAFKGPKGGKWYFDTEKFDRQKNKFV